jgi:hypothetical protein
MAMRQEVNVLALLKGEERYLYIYDDESHSALLEVLAEQARDPGLALNGFDAAILAQRSREQIAQVDEPSISDSLDD